MDKIGVTKSPLLNISPKPTSQSKGQKRDIFAWVHHVIGVPSNTYKTILDNIFICYMCIG